jgi:hypothetical protein
MKSGSDADRVLRKSEIGGGSERLSEFIALEKH